MHVRADYSLIGQIRISYRDEYLVSRRKFVLCISTSGAKSDNNEITARIAVSLFASCRSLSPFAPQKCVNEAHFRGAKGDNNKLTA